MELNTQQLINKLKDMPNGGPHHCGHCKQFEKTVCNLRNVEIESSYWTTCKNWNRDGSVPIGPIYAIVCEVKKGAGGYADIPYFNGHRVDTYQVGEGDTVIKFDDGKGNILELPDIESYLNYYKENNLK